MSLSGILIGRSKISLIKSSNKSRSASKTFVKIFEEREGIRRIKGGLKEIMVIKTGISIEIESQEKSMMKGIKDQNTIKLSLGQNIGRILSQNQRYNKGENSLGRGKKSLQPSKKHQSDPLSSLNITKAKVHSQNRCLCSK